MNENLTVLTCMVDSDKLEVPAIQVEKLGYAGISLVIPVPDGGEDLFREDI